MEYTPESELRSRIGRFQDSLREQGIDGVLIAKEEISQKDFSEIEETVKSVFKKAKILND